MPVPGCDLGNRECEDTRAEIGAGGGDDYALKPCRIRSHIRQQLYEGDITMAATNTPDRAGNAPHASSGVRPVRVGLGQMLVVPGEYEANLERAETMACRAADAECRILVLPECLDAGWAYPRSGEISSAIPGRTADALSRIARENGLIVAAGFTERAGEEVYNSALLIDETGQIVATHRKINELDFARRIYSTGRSLSVADTSVGRIGLNICADNHITSLSLGMAISSMGTQLLLSPSSWAVAPNRDTDVEPYDEWVVAYGTLDHDTGMPVVGVSNVGPVIAGEWAGWKCIGSSLAVGPDGEVLRQATYGDDAEELCIVDVPLKPAHSAR